MGRERTLNIRWLDVVTEITKPYMRELDVMEWRKVVRRVPDVGSMTEASGNRLTRTKICSHK